MLSNDRDDRGKPRQELNHALARYLRRRRRRFYPIDSAYAELVTDCLQQAQTDTETAALLQFCAARFRLDAKAATFHAIATLLGREMAEGTEEAYEDFLLNQAGLEGHSHRLDFLHLARAIAEEGDWGVRLYRLTSWLAARHGEESAEGQDSE